MSFGYNQTKAYARKNKQDEKKKRSVANFGGVIPVSRTTYSPGANSNTKSISYNLSIAPGADNWGVFNSARIKGYYSASMNELYKEFKSYGYLHESNSQGKSDVLMDFNREKDGSFRQEMNHLPLTYSTYDIFNVAGQGTGGMYRPHRNSLGIYKDPEYTIKTGGIGADIGVHFDLGLGAGVKFGGSVSVNRVFGGTSVWDSENNNKSYRHFNYPQNPDNKLFEEVYFKGGGEMTPSDEEFYTQMGWEQPVKFKLERNSLFVAKAGNFAELDNSIVRKDGGISTPSALAKANGRQIRSNVMTYLSASEASAPGISLNRFLKSYPLNTNWLVSATEEGYHERTPSESYGRISAHRKAHHLSEIAHYSPDGTQYVYGIPAYNTKQIERTFSVGKASKYDVMTGLISFNAGTDDSKGNNQGIQKLFTSTEIPSYAHSYLLTGVLSPDYVDLTGDGITDDDLGTAVRFNYTRYTETYKWRTPFEKARLDEGLKSDNNDQVGSYVYGEKELWYVHSIVSKTHIAEFKLSPRNDGVGVTGTAGGKDGNAFDNHNCQLKLDSIVIYSKLDRVKNGTNAVPIKTIVFVYDYSLCKGIPNSIHAGDSEKVEESGKLTLKEIYFTYGKSGKGRLSPYKFTYSETNPDYDLTKVDRWGNYAVQNGKSLMVDFPYVKQREEYFEELDENASAWSLTEIQLPSGGLIKVEYESDDYAYVQDKKTMQMMKIASCSNSKEADPTTGKNTLYEGGTSNEYLFFKLNKPITGINADEVFRDEYLRDENGDTMKELYFNFHVNLSMRTGGGEDGENYEYISGYVPITFSESGVSPKNPNYGYVKTPKISQGDAGITKINPIAKMIWQEALLDKRHLVLKGSTTTGDGATAIRGLLGTFPQMLNILTGPYQYLRWNKVGKYFKTDDSWIRLYNPHNKKKGGGARVKEIIINDNWASMDYDQNSTEYGQKFEYKLLDNNLNKTEYSSGVASYEPLVGGDENPFRQPVRYEEVVKAGPNKLLFQEEPFGETAMPPATVGYSSVIVTNIANGKTQGTATGFTLNEFYTAKDYPVYIDNTDLTYKDNSKGLVGNFLRGMFSYFRADYAAVSQGYVIKLNDMHGKPRSVKVFGEMNQKTDLISGTEYLYKESATGKLANKVKVLTNTGAVKEKMIGVEMDIAVDARHSKSVSIQGGVTFEVDGVFPFLFIPVPFVSPNYSQSNTAFFSSVITKVIQQYGVLEKTIAYDYGSQVTTHNHLWDEQTGNVLLTSVTNEFDDYIYNFSYPAHFAYDRMGPAYKNIAYVADLVTNASGKATVTFNPFVVGDELYMVNNSNSADRRKGWVLKSSENMVQVIDRNGDAITGNYKAKIIRSGRRNLSSVPVGSIATMFNPMPVGADTTLTLDNDIIQSAATTFSDEWQGYCDMIHHKMIEVCDTTDMLPLIYPFFRENIRMNGLNGERNLSKMDTLLLIYPDYWNDNTPVHISLRSFKKALYLDFDIWDSEGYIKKYLESEIKKHGLIENWVFWDSVYLVRNHYSGDYYFGINYENSDYHILLNIPMCNLVNESEPDNEECDSIRASVDSISMIIYPGNPEAFGVEAYDYTYMYRDGDSCKLYFTLLNCMECCRYIECNDVLLCEYELGETVNPFVNGMRGTWRPQASHAIVADRKYFYKGDTTDIRHDGLIKDYVPYWKFDPSGELVKNQSAGNKWVESNRITVFSPEGNELEEQNALGIYSSQLFGYTNTLVTAVAANARHRQIAFDNFEDYSFPYIGCRIDGHWDFRKDLPFSTYRINISGEPDVTISVSNIDVCPPYVEEEPADVFIADSIAHTGLHSLAIRPGKSHSVTRRIDFSSLSVKEADDTSLFRIDSYNKCISLFAPDTGFTYVISGWLHEAWSNLNYVNTFSNSKVKVELVNGESVVDFFDIVPDGRIIEGWQRFYGTFKIENGLNTNHIRVTLENEGDVISYFDDIRIHPFNSSMVSYVYHPVHLKIMAELDDNNFATFYEYDDEGSLIRIKKETEKGVLTIQESRKSVKKVQ